MTVALVRPHLLALALVFTGSGQAAGAQDSGAQVAQEQAADVNDRPTLIPSKPTSIPFELRDNLVVVHTTVNGKEQSAVLDSGSSVVLFDNRAAEAHGINKGQSAGDIAGAGPQAQQLRQVNVASLAVGPVRFAKLPGHSSNLEQLSKSAGFPVELLIGAPAFKYGAVRVDYRRKRVTFGPSGSIGKCAAPIPISVDYDVPVIDAEIRPTPTSEPVRLKLVLDLGTRHQAIILGGPFVRSDAGKALIDSGTAQQVGHGTGGELQGSVARIAELRLGTMTFTGLEAALSSGAAAFEAGVIDGSLGVPLWRTSVITFDYPAKTLCIEK